MPSPPSGSSSTRGSLSIPSPRSSTSAAHLRRTSESLSDTHPDDPAHGGGSTPVPPRPVPTVRFRSRVRITSGLHRARSASHTRHRSASLGIPGSHDSLGGGGGGGSSVGSASPSSSISAPLRAVTQHRGSYSQRLLALARQNRRRPSEASDSSAEAGQVPPGARVGDRTPLIGAGSGRVYGASRRYPIDESDEDEEDETKPKFCTRDLLDYRWWWWKAEAFVCCCCCPEDSDEE